VVGLGAVLILAAATHHLRELLAIGEVVGPLVALALDGLSALCLVYAGYWLSSADVDRNGE